MHKKSIKKSWKFHMEWTVKWIHNTELNSKHSNMSFHVVELLFGILWSWQTCEILILCIILNSNYLLQNLTLNKSTLCLWRSLGMSPFLLLGMNIVCRGWTPLSIKWPVQHRLLFFFRSFTWTGHFIDAFSEKKRRNRCWLDHWNLTYWYILQDWTNKDVAIFPL